MLSKNPVFKTNKNIPMTLVSIQDQYENPDAEEMKRRMKLKLDAIKRGETVVFHSKVLKK